VTLYEGNRLNLSIESRVILPWYRDLFTAQEISTARYRLQDHRFRVEEYLGGGQS
jgi:hypothetical protein